MRDVRTGAKRIVRARYVIGADGAHSRVRTELGIQMRGADHLHEGISVLFRAPLWDVVGPHRYGIYWVTHPAARGSLVPAGRGDRWIYGFEWNPGASVLPTIRRTASRSGFASRPVSPVSTPPSSGSARSRSQRCSRTPSGRAAPSLPATPRTV